MFSTNQLQNHIFYHGIKNKSVVRVFSGVLMAAGLLPKFEKTAAIREGYILFFALLFCQRPGDVLNILVKHQNEFLQMIDEFLKIRKKYKHGLQAVQFTPFNFQADYDTTYIDGGKRLNEAAGLTQIVECSGQFIETLESIFIDEKGHLPHFFDND